MITDYQRAKAYLDEMPPGISGSGGHKATFAAVTALRHGFALSDTDAWALFLEYNQRCQPPWSATELKHKFDSVDSSKHPMSRGYLVKTSGGVIKKGRIRTFSLPQLARGEPRKRTNHSPRTLGAIKLPEQYLSTAKNETVELKLRPVGLESESEPPPIKHPHSAPPERCGVCWNRWGRFLRESQCICTGDVQR